MPPDAVLMNTEKAVRFGFGVIGGWEIPSMGVGTQTQVLFKSSVYS